MPIETETKIRIFTESEFHRLAHQVTGIAFGIHNEFGRLLDESVYQEALRHRCEAAGITCQREVRITVQYGDFRKTYFIDLLLACGLMVETKTVDKLTLSHHSQALQYLLLTGMRHGLLLNLRPNQVEKRFVSTALDLTERKRICVWDDDWTTLNSSSDKFRRIILDLLADWGAFLQVSLYRDAIVHCFGGPEAVLKKIPISDGNATLGVHEVCLIAEDTAIAITALKVNQSNMATHLSRFVDHTQLKYIQWVNMSNHDIEFRTIR